MNSFSNHGKNRGRRGQGASASAPTTKSAPRQRAKPAAGAGVPASASGAGGEPASAPSRSGAAKKTKTARRATPAGDATPKKERRPTSDSAGKVVTIGSVMADTIAVAEAGLVERAEFKLAGVTMLMIEEGRKYTAQSIVLHLGGGGANSAVSAARLGWRAATLGVVGVDPNGEMLLQKLSAEGVDSSAIRRNPDVGTGVSLIVTSDQSNAAILVFRGASETLTIDDIRDPDFEGADLVYIGPLSSGSADCFPALVEQGAWAGAMVCVNPGVRQLRNRGEAFLGAVANVDLVLVNAREFSVLTLALFARGVVSTPKGDGDASKATGAEDPRLLGQQFGEGGQKASFRDALAALHGLGPRFVAVTDGAFGSYLSIATEREGAKLLFQEPARLEVVKGTAGAGDSYGSTLACSLAQGLAPEDAMLRATLNAASVVGRDNTTDGLMTREALEEAAAASTLRPAVMV